MVGMRRWNTRYLGRSRAVVRSAQRHKGGIVGPRPTRGTAAELSAPLTGSHTNQAQDDRAIVRHPVKKHQLLEMK